MKRTHFAALLAAVMTLSLAGCGKQITENVNPTETTATTAAETESETTTTSAATTASTTTTASTSDTVSTTTTAAQTSAAPASTTAASTAATKASTAATTARAAVSSGVYTPARPQTQNPTPAPSPTEAPQPATTLSPEETPIEPPAGWTWYLEDATFDGQCFAVPIKVKEDPGIYGYNLNLTINGMSIADAGFKLVEIEQGDAYAFSTFMPNLQKGTLAAAENIETNNRIAGQEATVAIYYLTPPEDAQPGQVYQLAITGLSVGNYANQKFNETNGIQLGAATLTIPEPAETTASPAEVPPAAETPAAESPTEVAPPSET